MNKQKKAERIEEADRLSAFIPNYIPSGWKEPIKRVSFTHHYEWYEVEAMKAFFSQSKDSASKKCFVKRICDKLIELSEDAEGQNGF